MPTPYKGELRPYTVEMLEWYEEIFKPNLLQACLVGEPTSCDSSQKDRARKRNTINTKYRRRFKLCIFML